VPIPPGITSVVVGLMCNVGGSSQIEVWGTTDMFAFPPGTGCGISLKVEEKPASTVQQAGPGTTSTAIPP
jgi:hypothetical protein